jgi:hypothetical protein
MFLFINIVILLSLPKEILYYIYMTIVYKELKILYINLLMSAKQLVFF